MFVPLALLATGAFLINDTIEEKALQSLPYGFEKFNVHAPLPTCARWKKNMPASRDADTYNLYINARKLWRSKIEWQLTHEEAIQIFTDVKKAADLGDWGARSLLAHFYLEGLGPLETNRVIKPDPYKAVEIVRMAAKEMQPWALYDLGVAYEHGYGGAHYDLDLAWAYYLKAAQFGSPEAQMALASAYAHEGKLNDEETMIQCAYQQNHGPAAFALGVDRRTSKKFKDSIKYFYDGVKFGSRDCASALHQLFETGFWITTSALDKPALKVLNISADEERSNRYQIIYDALQINPDLKLSKLDEVVPLPPAKLPSWSGIEDAIAPESSEQPTY